MRETLIYLLIGCSSLLIVSFVPHMLLEGIVSVEMEHKITIGVTIFWFFVLSGLGWDIVRKRRQQNGR